MYVGFARKSRYLPSRPAALWPSGRANAVRLRHVGQRIRWLCLFLRKPDGYKNKVGDIHPDLRNLDLLMGVKRLLPGGRKVVIPAMTSLRLQRKDPGRFQKLLLMTFMALLPAFLAFLRWGGLFVFVDLKFPKCSSSIRTCVPASPIRPVENTLFSPSPQPSGSQAIDARTDQGRFWKHRPWAGLRLDLYGGIGEDFYHDGW